MSIVPCIVLYVLGLVVPWGGEREEVALAAERGEYLQPVRDALVREPVDDKLGNALLWPECCRNVAVVAQLPCDQELVEKIPPGEVVGGLERELGWLFRIPPGEQERPVAKAKRKRSQPFLVGGGGLRRNFNDNVQFFEPELSG